MLAAVVRRKGRLVLDIMVLDIMDPVAAGNGDGGSEVLDAVAPRVLEAGLIAALASAPPDPVAFWPAAAAPALLLTVASSALDLWPNCLPLEALAPRSFETELLGGICEVLDSHEVPPRFVNLDVGAGGDAMARSKLPANTRT